MNLNNALYSRLRSWMESAQFSVIAYPQTQNQVSLSLCKFINIKFSSIPTTNVYVVVIIQ